MLYYNFFEKSMLVLISPAKTLDYDSALPYRLYTQPRLLSYAQHLIDHCRTLSSQDIQTLMKVSQNIAEINVQRFQDWQNEFTLDNARQAIFAFKGDVYTGLNAYHLNLEDFSFTQEHLRILSGLYGVLRPLDLMMPYRLEMGTKLKTAFGKTLYEFWGSTITDLINQDLTEIGSDLLINLASEEYFKAVNVNQLQAKVVKITFLDEKYGQYKIISFYAKKARGLMARFIIQNQIDTIQQLKQFDVDGYYFDAFNSTESELIFKRDEIMDND